MSFHWLQKVIGVPHCALQNVHKGEEGGGNVPFIFPHVYFVIINIRERDYYVRFGHLTSFPNDLFCEFLTFVRHFLTFFSNKTKQLFNVT